MGKAGRWIRNFLMGKREDKAKKTGTLLDTPVVTHTPELRRRWSFRASLRANTISHKSSISFDSILMSKPATFEYETLQKHTMPPKLNAHAAATKIQAVYRSYLARRALRALRALVKLQALARGYLVRKQMNTVLRSIHAVMAIQVRARIHRIQMADEPPAMSGRRKSYGEPSPSDRQIRKEISAHTGDGNCFTASGGLRSRSVRVDNVPAERLEYGSRVCGSGRLSVSQREHQLKMSSSPSTLSFTDSSSTTYDGQLVEHPLKIMRRNSRRYSASPENRHPFILPPSQCSEYIPSNFVPNYMINTRSSEAKARSHSEPRQRPKLGTKQKSKRSSSMEWKNDTENQYPWLNKPHHSHKFTDSGDSGSYMRALAGVSQHIRLLTAFEVPPMNLY
ncbi:hypothetical protein ACS0TY_005677 [Phlomoides rotata]